MDYSDLDHNNIVVFDLRHGIQKEHESQESENNVYMNDPPEEIAKPVQESYYYPYIFPLYDF